MTNQHPITPPPELVEQWREKWSAACGPFAVYLATQGAQWGADQELEACCEWLQDPDLNVDTYKLRTARRPKPPSLKEQALKALKVIEFEYVHSHSPSVVEATTGTIRRALETLDD